MSTRRLPAPFLESTLLRFGKATGRPGRFRILLAIALTFTVFLAVPSVRADGQRTSRSGSEARVVTEGDFARWLVDVLGLGRQLPRNPTLQQCFAVLTRSGIAPADGWQRLDVVTAGTLARVLVEAMNQQQFVANPNSDAAYIDYLKRFGIQIPHANRPNLPVSWENIEHVFRDDPPPRPPVTPT